MIILFKSKCNNMISTFVYINEGAPEKEGVMMNNYDSRQIEEICKSTWEPLYRYIYYRVQNREEAEDITQETYAKSLSYSKLKDIESDKYIAFFKAVALNIIRDRWRKSKKAVNKVDIEAVN